MSAGGFIRCGNEVCPSRCFRTAALHKLGRVLDAVSKCDSRWPFPLPYCLFNSVFVSPPSLLIRRISHWGTRCHVPGIPQQILSPEQLDEGVSPHFSRQFGVPNPVSRKEHSLTVSSLCVLRTAAVHTQTCIAQLEYEHSPRGRVSSAGACC